MIAGAVAVVLLVLAFFMGRWTAPEGSNGEVSRDTVVVYHTDTIVNEMPVYVTTKVVDTMLVQVRDTLMLSDTVYMAVEREQRLYEDSLYRAWVSGYRPALDSIAIYQKERVVQVTVREPYKVKTHWGIGVSAGYGIGLSGGKFVTVPYVGVGLQYNFIGW